TAYEEAIKLIQSDKKERLEMLSRVEKEIARIKKGRFPHAQLAALDALQFDLQVKSELNDPEIQKQFKLGQIDMSRPVFRYMRQKHFEKAPRSKLLERITQMNVIPDLLPPDLMPVVDVQIRVNEEAEPIEPGVFVKPEQTINAPLVDVTNFHMDTRLYTLLLVDPDSPDVANKTYKQRCHWLMANVPLSATQSRVTDGNTILEYVPPHPEKGTKYHRYTLIAYEQPNQDKLDIKAERDAFDTKAFAEKHGLKVRGVSFFREEWDPSVSKVYEIMGVSEPIYGKPPKPKRVFQPTKYF
ncbi:phosphatidylethanolamine-binding protein, partial [Radiomyces spectabilis]|uniref:phosphatidylethanolamine-binding protein n=1 Tax=Radiomyces spectabilis TaxID=64574 RepID=UPI00222111DA